MSERSAGNLTAALDAAQKALELNKENLDALEQLTLAHYELGNIGKAIEYCNCFLEIAETMDRFIPYNMFAVIYLLRQSGDNERANQYLERWIEYDTITAYRDRLGSLINKAYIAALQGQNEEALEYLTQIARQEKLSVWIYKLRTSPVFNEIMTEPEFIRIIGEIERKFEAQREGDRQRLEEKGLL